MKTILQNKVAVTGKTTGIIKITPNMVQAHAGELARLKGRHACDVTESDLAQARRELTGKPDAKA
jgi:hypothetical protein